MEQNLILQAGAGTGKTHALVTLALHILSGATARGAPVPPSRLVALTFTDKAGAEMQGRLQQRLAPLAAGGDIETLEPDLAASFRRLGTAFPSPEQWRRIRRDVPLASITTFHGFCAAQLRRLSSSAGLDPAFEMLEEEESRVLFEEAALEHILRALARDDRDARLLVEAYGLTNEWGGGTVELIRSVLLQIAEDGRPAESLDDGRFEEARAAAEFEASRQRFHEAITGLAGLADKVRIKLATPIAAFQEVARTLEVSNAKRVIEKVRAIKKTFIKPRLDSGAPIERLMKAADDLEIAHAGIATAPIGRAFVAMAAQVEHAYRRAKDQRGALDFSDLQRRFRDLLQTDKETRKLVKSRFDALLVDEFQDTSRLQLDLVSMLAESRNEQAELAGATDVAGSIRFESGLLCIVGDRKQSIYEFRGADVAVFAQAESLLRDPAHCSPPALVEFLTNSRRSRPALVNFANDLFREAMSAGDAPFELKFTPEDALTPVFEEEITEPLVEIVRAEGKRSDEYIPDEARKIAARIDQLVHATENPRRVRSGLGDDMVWRPVEGRDIAILFRRMTRLEDYREALTARGIAHVVVGGSGFYATREVLDAWSLLRAVDDPEDVLASVALLRSPWCSLRDETITRLSLTTTETGQRFSGVRLSTLLAHPPELADEGERRRLQALLNFARAATRDFDRLGAARTLSLGFRELDYLAAVSTLPEADTIGANLEKLLSVLGSIEKRVPSPHGAVRVLTERIRTPPREPEAPSAEESDPRSVRLMTIHQAKGLEFPVVFLADCGSSDAGETSAVAYDRDLGLGLGIRDENDEATPGPHLNAIRERQKARTAAESLRMLYVGVTRARDYLVLSGILRNNSWLDQAAKLGPTHVRVVDVDPKAPRLGTVEAIHVVADGSLAPVASVPLARVITTVTRLQDFAECPERYRLRHELSIAEPRFPNQSVSVDKLDSMALGSGAHRLLELADFKALDEKALDSLLATEGVNTSRPEVAAMRTSVATFLRSPLAVAWRRLPPERRWRELPFRLTFDLGEGKQLQVKGQIDVLALTPEHTSVLDYKLGTAEGHDSEHHRFQLATYGLAARQFMEGANLPLQAGIVPLKTPKAPVSWVPLPNADLDAHAQLLKESGGHLLQALSTNQWSKLPAERCRELECGFLRRCHGSVRAPESELLQKV
jgi:ATP-dependent exoDNAse (exonuclease V) beta subunit